MIIPLAGGSYQQRSLDLNAQRCVNMYPVFDELGRSQISLIPTEGLKLIGTSSQGICRGLHVVDTRMFGVFGSELQEVLYNPSTETATFTDFGTLASSSGTVSMAHNGTQLIIVDGSTSGYIFNHSTDTFSTISDIDFLGADKVTFLDSFFFLNEPDSGRVYQSAANDGTTYDATEIATAEALSDNLVAIESDTRELWLFGQESTEVWWNEANPSAFVLSKRANAMIEMGCAAAATIVKIDQSLWWLNEHGEIVHNIGYQAEVVSTEPITRAIQNYSILSDATAFHYKNAGHSFYVITFPEANTTWVFDLTTQLWHERRSETGGKDKHYRVQYYGFFKTAHIVSDIVNGKLYILDEETFTEDGNEIRRFRTTSHFSNENKYIAISSFEVDCDTGQGLQSGQGSDPLIALEISKDGGRTWGPKRFRSMGKIGNYEARIRWNKLGVARVWTARLTITDPIFFQIFNGFIF